MSVITDFAKVQIVLGRFGFRCAYCGKSFDHTPLTKGTVDHIIPRSKGGTDEIENLLPSCGACNVAKGKENWEFLRSRIKGENKSFFFESGVGVEIEPLEHIRNLPLKLLFIHSERIKRSKPTSRSAKALKTLWDDGFVDFNSIGGEDEEECKKRIKKRLEYFEFVEIDGFTAKIVLPFYKLSANKCFKIWKKERAKLNKNTD